MIYSWICIGSGTEETDYCTGGCTSVQCVWNKLVHINIYSRLYNRYLNVASIELFHVISSPLRMRRKTEENCHVDVQANSMATFTNRKICLLNQTTIDIDSQNSCLYVITSGVRYRCKLKHLYRCLPMAILCTVYVVYQDGGSRLVCI